MAKKIPMRQCIGCGEMKGKKELLRILRTQDEEVILDATGRKNGRGAYICPNAECLKRAKKSKYVILGDTKFCCLGRRITISNRIVVKQRIKERRG